MFGSIIGAIGNVVGGILGSKSADKDREAQEAFARNRISWTVEDAKRSGIHPLAALNAGYPGYNPVGDGGLGGAIAAAADGVGKGLQTRKLRSLEEEAAQAQIDLVKAQTDETNARTQSISAAINAMLQNRVGGTGDGTNYARNGEDLAGITTRLDPREEPASSGSETIVHPGGTTLTLPKNMDDFSSSVLQGLKMLILDAKNNIEDRKMRRIVRDYYEAQKPKWDYLDRNTRVATIGGKKVRQVRRDGKWVTVD